jgi:hypothetical protein
MSKLAVKMDNRQKWLVEEGQSNNGYLLNLWLLQLDGSSLTWKLAPRRH